MLKPETKAVLDKMFQYGINQNDILPVELAFYGNEADMSNLEHYLRKDGYTFDRQQSEAMLIAIKPFSISYATLPIIIEQHEKIAQRFNVTFDGWSCSLPNPSERLS